MKARIYVNQKEALKSNKNEFGNIDIEFKPEDLSAEERVELAECNTQDDCFLVNRDYKFESDGVCGNYISIGVTRLSEVAKADLSTLKQILQERLALRIKKAKENQEYEKKEEEKKGKREQLEKEAFLICEDKLLEMESACIFEIGIRNEIHSGIDVGLYGHLSYTIEEIFKSQKLKTKKEEFDKYTIKQEAEEEAKQKEERDEECRIEKAKDDQISAWVIEHGTDSQQERKELDLLEDEEVINDIRNSAFSVLAEINKYEKITASDVCECEREERYDEYCDVDFESYECKATEAEFDAMQDIQKLVPDAKIIIKEHVGESEDCKNTVKIKSFLVSIQV
ncbi:MAG: hypothetical protein ACUZ8H_14085, partial [Candidatus Anammoxibacter sp.]